ncbi:MAG: Omp28-related outer membrane protein, partial [Bacteroidota bacterium]|nr:Omp28-related outer membrane protein [Bacteroidota bacterium]
KAAKELHEIDSIYPGRILGLATHVGSFADPYPGYGGSPSTAFLADYQTAAGTEYDDFFGASTFGLPQGMFNRKDYNDVTQDHLKFYPNWKTYAASIIAEPSVVDLQMIADYDTATRKICLAVKSTFLSSMSGEFKLVILLTQDSIIDWQDNQGTIQANYLHRHMLRDAINGAWGDVMATGSLTTGTTNTKRFAYTIPEEYNTIPFDDHHGHILAFLYNTATHEIIQSEEVDLIP